MKQLFFILAIVFLSSASYAQPDFSDIPEHSSVYFSPGNNRWSADRTEDAVEFIKHYTTGDNKFSEYFSGGLGYDSNSSREFLYNGNLIGYNKNTLKFHRIIFENGTLTEERLNEEELRELFPSCEIIRVSQFRNNMIRIKRTPFKNQKFLIMNDTNTLFYNYQFENIDNSMEEFNCIFTPVKRGKLYFSPRGKSVLYTPYVIHSRIVL